MDSVWLLCFSEAKCLRDEEVLQTLPVGTTASFYFSDLGPQLTWGTVSPHWRIALSGITSSDSFDQRFNSNNKKSFFNQKWLEVDMTELFYRMLYQVKKQDRTKHPNPLLPFSCFKSKEKLSRSPKSFRV